MDLFTETTPAETVPNDRKDLIIQINRLTNDLETVRKNYEFSANQTRELMQKISNVQGFIRDLYSECGEIPDYVEEIAGYLDIELTKEIAGTSTFEISWTAQVPLDFDADDFEISFDVNCETYEAEEFDWNEENTETNAEEV